MTQEPKPQPALDPAYTTGTRPPAGRAIGIGVAVVALFVAGFAIWSTFAPLQSAAIAPGLIGVDTKSKTVQHLEGGIIHRIHVREGQTVAIGDTLITLDETRLKARNAVLEAQISSSTGQLRYVRQEIEDMQQLVAKGLARKPRLLAIKRREVELVGLKAQAEAEQQAVKDAMRRLVIRAPIGGRVVELQVHTPGGVIEPGMQIMTLVPQNENLVIEARLNPNDIDIVRPGLHAQVRLVPYSARHVAPLDGRVAWVSADRIKDERSGEAYYLARIELAGAGLPDGVTLYPGMPVEAMILTGPRTLLDYLVEPVMIGLGRAFREK